MLLSPLVSLASDSLFLYMSASSHSSSTRNNKKYLKKIEDHERAATAFASAASALDAVLASVAASHPPDRLAALRVEESSLKRELEAKRELVSDVAAKIDGWRRRAKEALVSAEDAAAGVAAVGGGDDKGPEAAATAAPIPGGQLA